MPAPRSTPPAVTPEAGFVPFVGRVRELAALDAALARMLEGRGTLILLGGEPGIGKTRLTEELIDRARRRGVTVCWGRCWEGEGAPAFWPWVQAVRQYMRGRDPAELLADLGLAAADVARVVPEVGRLLPEVPSGGRAAASGREQERFRFFDGLTGFFGAAARRQPLLVALDDLQWADTPSLLLLQFLARELGDMRVLVLLTYRDGGLTAEHSLSPTLAALARERACQRLILDGFDRGEIGRYIELVARRRPPARVINALHERTDGNPLFLQEVVRLLASVGHLDADADADPATWRLAVPAEVRQTIVRRIAPLPAPCRRLLDVAAVIGREFDLDVLQDVAADDIRAARPDWLRAALEPALAASLVVGAEASGRYAFAHALIRETVYAALASPARERLHRAVALAIERLHAGHLEGHLAALASHWAQAGRDVDDRAKALIYARWAGDQSLARFAYEDAARFYEEALAVLGTLADADARMQCELWLTLADARLRVSDVAGERAACARAAALARDLDDAALFGRAALGFGWTFYHTGSDPERIALLEEAQQRLPAVDSALRARVMARLGLALFWRRDAWPRPLDLSAAAVRMARQLGEPATLAFALNARLFCLWGNGALNEQSATARELVDIADAAGEFELGLQGRNWLITMLVEAGDVVSAEREMVLQERVAVELRLPLYHWFAANWRAMLAALKGDFDAAERLAEVALAIGERAEPENAVPSYMGLLFVVRRERGQLEPLADMLRAQGEEAEGSAPHRCGMAFIYAETGRFDEARREIEGIHLAPASVNDPGWVSSLMALGEACAIVDLAEPASPVYAALLPEAARNVTIGMAISCQGSAARVLGRLATTMRRFADADRHFADALAMHERMAAPPLIARTQHDWATMLLVRDAPGDRERAGALLAAALRTARALQMDGLAAQAERLLGAAPTADRLASPDVVAAGAAEALFRQEGDYWTIGDDGNVARLKDSKGLQYIAYLLRHPGQRFPAIELAAVSAEAVSATRSAERSPDVWLDATARAAYRRRLAELHAEIEEAERMHDLGRLVRAREERERIEAQLAAAVGLRGRVRPIGTAAERARWAVTKRIKSALDRVRVVHPRLGRHLSTTVATGYVCGYLPDPQHRVDWRL